MMLKIVAKNVFKIMTMPNNWVGHDHNLAFCSFYTIREIVFSAKIWFVKTSTRVVKYESQVVKSNPPCLTTCFLLFISFRCDILLTNISIELSLLALAFFEKFLCFQ